ncbi:hypothetical protein BKA70DRAFT_1452539 [Coprinopsis sp. MPI-PUGE-AT-0042]|nr:hypothetical protein BKA70DRAFT_1452539 [Coprinopsis sp. MPI-PUGE-AT-0042]
MPKASKSSKKADVPFGPPVPYERPTTHPLLTTTSHRASASALQAAAVHQANAVHPHEATTRKEKAAWMSRLVAELKAHPSSYAPLVAAGTEEVDEKLREALDSFFLVSPHSPPPVPRWNYVSWLIDTICNKDHKFVGILPAAYKERQQNLLYYRALRKKVMSKWLLFKTVEAYKNFHSLIFHYRIKRRLPGGESPQVGKWVAEWPGVAKAARKLFHIYKPEWSESSPMDAKIVIRGLMVNSPTLLGSHRFTFPCLCVQFLQAASAPAPNPAAPRAPNAQVVDTPPLSPSYELISA